MNPPLIEDFDRGIRVTAYDGIVSVDMMYPRSEGHIAEVEVGIEDVRAADSIRISYDFTRDGYSIKQASRFEWNLEDKECDSDWQEVAFVQAWAREVPPAD
jgi:hypothetical protein